MSFREAAAATEFQKIVDHPGVSQNDPIGALAAWPAPPSQDFLGLWKDADPDIPILKEARAEYAKLQ